MVCLVDNYRSLICQSKVHISQNKVKIKTVQITDTYLLSRAILLYFELIHFKHQHKYPILLVKLFI